MWFELGAAAGGLAAGGLSAALPWGGSKESPHVSSWLTCPRCGRRCPARQFVPVLSLASKRRHCDSCGLPVAWRSSAIGAADAVLWGLVAALAAPVADVAAGWALATLAVLAAATDLQSRVIPNRLVLAAALVWVPLGIWSGHAASGLAGAAGLALPLLLVALWRPAALGMGDVKLAAVAGLYVGWPAALGALFASMLSASLAGLLLVVFRGRSRRATIPLGPFLALGSLAAFLISRH